MRWLQDLIVHLAEIILHVRELERINTNWAESRTNDCNLARIEGYEAAENQEPLRIYDEDGCGTIRRNFVGKSRYSFAESKRKS